MKALVTGASGFVGPHLVAHLESAGDQVRPIDMANGPDLRDADGWVELVTGDRPDVIYHLAGWSDVGGSWEAPRSVFEINAMGTVSVLEAARIGRVERVVVISSADVYGIVAEGALPVTESTPAEAVSPYGASKLAAEAAAAHYHRGWGLETVVARPFNHFGPGQSPRFIAGSMARQIAEIEAGSRDRLTHGELSPRRDMTDVRDVVRAYRCLAADGTPGEIYNICSGRAIAMSSLLEQLSALSEADVRCETDPTLMRPVEIPVLVGSNERLQTATGWEPEIDLESTLRSVLDDARARLGSAVRSGVRS